MLNKTDDSAETTVTYEQPGGPVRQGTANRLRSGVKAGWDEGTGCGSTGGPDPLGAQE